MPPEDPETEALLERAGEGDPVARDELLVRFRERLRQMVAFRLDRRLAARMDPSDVVQETLTQAAGKLPEYLRQRPLPFYAWLRQLAWERIIQLHRAHIQAQRRSITREETRSLPLGDESALELAHRVLARGGSPISQVLRNELQGRVRHVLARLGPRDCEVLALRHLEQLSVREMSAVLGISEGTVKVRHLRALRRFRNLMNESQLEKNHESERS
jgi:RNA polymerase sigma-70 factor (ECF subfamily)